MKNLFTILLAAISLTIFSCNKETSTTQTNVMNNLLTNKNWVCEGITSHYFRSDGVYCNSDGTMEFGTWKWLNNSDSLEINKDGIGRYVWYVKYCTETEMSARNGNDPYLVFKKQ